MIPEGQYGGGTVMLWDRGTYYVYGENPLKSWKEGKMHLVLDGEKAEGEWTLIRLRGDGSGKNQWLLLKTGSSNKPISKKRDDQSVKSGPDDEADRRGAGLPNGNRIGRTESGSARVSQPGSSAAAAKSGRSKAA